MIIYNILIIILFLNSAFGQDSKWDIEKPKIRFITKDKVGLQISIPDKPGLKFFAFHGAINRFIKPNEFGDFYGVVIKSANKFWTFIKNDIKIKEKDILYYWYHWQINNINYNSQAEEISGSDIGLPLDTPLICYKSKTVVKEQLKKCAGELLFEENFDTFDPSIWNYEIKIPTEDSAFVSYQDEAENIFIKNGLLNILPTAPYNDKQIKTLNKPWKLTKCTEKNENECLLLPSYGGKIIPPVRSAKIRSKFSFKYGRIEVRAKLPIGDWIIPQILLEPRDYDYSSGQEYSSGQMRIAFARGNQKLRHIKNETQILDGRVLYGGVVLEPKGIERRFLKHTQRDIHFGESFCNYTLVWTEDYIKIYVDENLFGEIKGGFHNDNILSSISDERAGGWRVGSNMAPFDKEFVISFGVSVGGVSDFPDDVVDQNNNTKPWINEDPKAQLKFYENKSAWKKTWNDDLSSLKVDYVRVYSV